MTCRRCGAPTHRRLCQGCELARYHEGREDIYTSIAPDEEEFADE